MPNQAQIKDWVAKQKAKGMTDADITQVLVQKGVLSQDGHATVDDSGNVIAAQPEAPKEKGFFGKAADVINEGYDKYKNAPVIKQATQVVGGAVGAAGGLIGGAIGAVANPIANVIENKPIFEGEGKAIVDTAKSTAKFGYDIGKEGAAAAPLGGAGRAVNLAVAYGQGYQGANDLIEGYKEGDAAKMFEGGLSLGTSVVGAKSAFGNHGVLLDPEVAKQIKELPAEARKAAVQKAYIKTVDAYRQVMNMNKSDIIAESRNMKDTPKFLAEQGIIPEMSADRKFSPDKSIETLRERVEPLQTKLNDTLASDPKPMNLDVLEQRAVAEISKNKKMPALDRKEMISSVQEAIDAEKEANGGKLNQKTGRIKGGEIVQSPEFNQMKSSFWNKGYNPAKTKVANSSIWQLGHEAKTMIEQAYEGKADIQGMNKQIGDYASAIRLLDNGLRGKVVPGGRMGNLIYKLVGATAMSGLGPVGSILGAEGMGKIANFLSSPEVKLGVHQKVLQTLQGGIDTSNPEVGKVLDNYSKKYDEVRAQYGGSAKPAAPAPMPEQGAPMPTDASGNVIPKAPPADLLAPKPGEAQGKKMPDMYKEVAPLKPGEAIKDKRTIRGNVRKVYKYAPEAKNLIDSMADSIAEQVGGKVAKAPLKGQARAMQKVINDYGGDATRLGDLARNTIIVKDQKALMKAVELLKDDPNVRSVKEVQPETDALGYFGVNAKVAHPNGMLAEVQVHTPEMIFAKEKPADARRLLGDAEYDAVQKKLGNIEGGLGHKLYEEWRDIDRSDPTQYHKAKALEEKSKAYYDKVRKAYAKKPIDTGAAQRAAPAAAGAANKRDDSQK
jgi:hypothetical protein